LSIIVYLINKASILKFFIKPDFWKRHGRKTQASENKLLQLQEEYLKEYCLFVLLSKYKHG